MRMLALHSLFLLIYMNFNLKLVWFDFETIIWGERSKSTISDWERVSESLKNRKEQQQQVERKYNNMVRERNENGEKLFKNRKDNDDSSVLNVLFYEHTHTTLFN